jgi:hypothetical protein
MMEDGNSVDNNADDKTSASSNLRFSFDELRAAGERIGDVVSCMPPPTTTFEELYKRAKVLDQRILQRERSIVRLRLFAACVAFFGIAVLVSTAMPQE